MPIVYWTLESFCDMICKRILNKLDAFIVIEGDRGLGKSTLAWKILKRIKRKMKKRGLKQWQFRPKYDIIYTREEAIKFFHKWQHSAMLDEMVNVTFNRDFYNEEQKDFIKIVNMNRDHNNVCVACIPAFKVLDSQIKGLTAIRLHVYRRGIAIVHFPNKSIYASDRWDEKVNEKTERKWLSSGAVRPQFSKLTTFKGYLTFTKLTEKDELLYQSIKDKKRNIIAKEKGQDSDDKKEKPIEKIYDKLINFKIKNDDMLRGMMESHDLNIKNSKDQLRKMLEKNSKQPLLIWYYTKQRGKKEAIEEFKVWE